MSYVKREKTLRGGGRGMATLAPGLPSIQSSGGTLAAGGKVDAGHFCAIGAERIGKRGHFLITQNDGRPRLDIKAQPACRRSRAHYPWPAIRHPAGTQAPGLHVICMHDLPAGLRPQKDRRWPRQLSDGRLFGNNGFARISTNSGTTGTLAESATSTKKLTLLAPPRHDSREYRAATARTHPDKRSKYGTSCRHGTKSALLTVSIVPWRGIYLDVPSVGDL